MNIKTIMCPVDFSENSHAALTYASSLAAEWGAFLHIVHVDDSSPEYRPGPGGYGYLPSAEHLHEMHEREWFHRVAPTKPGVNYAQHYLKGLPTRELLRFAEREGVQLIVIGSHGRTGVRRALLGSVAEGVTRQAKCAVMTVKQPWVFESDDSLRCLGRQDQGACQQRQIHNET